MTGMLPQTRAMAISIMIVATSSCPRGICIGAFYHSTGKMGRCGDERDQDLRRR